MSTTSLLQDVETYIQMAGINATQFGKLVMNDPNFVFDLRNGRDYRRSTAERVRKFLSNAPTSGKQ